MDKSKRILTSVNTTLDNVKSKAAKAIQFLSTEDKIGQLRRKKKQAAKSKRLRATQDFSNNGQWPKSPELQPWFDQPNAKKTIADRNLSDEETRMLENWVDNGYVIADVLDPHTCDNLRNEMVDDVWGGRKKYPKLELIAVRRQTEERAHKILQTDLIRYPDAEKQWMMHNSNWRIHGMDGHSSEFERAAENDNLLRIGSLLYNQEAESGFTLSFGIGSEQALHQDYAQFHIYPRNYLIGCWIALEDIHPDSGPLEYYPGSHKLGYWLKHDANYPQTNLRTGNTQDNAQYFRWLREQSENTSERKELIIKKGQALFWHACLAHGGSARKNKTLSRHSLVLHLVPKNANVDKRLIIDVPD